MPPRKDLTGQRFGKLVIVDRIKGGAGVWRCLCDCGRIRIAKPSALRKRAEPSCGCLVRKHGMSSSRTYTPWQQMIDRCTNPRSHAWKYYGGRGITICEPWRGDFRNFLTDMGERPAGTSIDRIDNDGNYEPGNCRWATAIEQANNKRHRPPGSALNPRQRMQAAWLVNARGFTRRRVADLFEVNEWVIGKLAKDAGV